MTEVHRAWYQANKERLAVLRRQWQLANPTKQAEYDRRRRVKDPEHARAVDRAKAARLRASNPEYAARQADIVKRWREANRERNRELTARWRRENPDRVRFLNAAYRARSRRANGSSTYEQLQARVAFYGGVCAYCGGAFDAIDHVIPLTRGGTAWPANLRPACRACNGRKKNKPAKVWLASIRGAS